MHIAYSVFRSNKIKKPAGTSAQAKNMQRYNGYLAACKKHRQTITEIQEYMPGWQPPFLTGSSL